MRVGIMVKQEGRTLNIYTTSLYALKRKQVSIQPGGTTYFTVSTFLSQLSFTFIFANYSAHEIFLRSPNFYRPRSI